MRIGNLQKSKLLFFFGCLLLIIHFSILPDNAYSSYLGMGFKYSYSFLNYKIIRDNFFDLDEEDYAEAYARLNSIGIKNNAKVRSTDYGICVILDDAEEFKELGLFQMSFECYYFTIPFDDVDNTIKGWRYGFSLDLGVNVLNFENNIVYAALTTGLYRSNGTSAIDDAAYSTVEMPLGIIIGDKIALGENSALIISGTYNFYNHIINNNADYLLAIFNTVNYDMLSFATRRNEFIVSCSFVYQMGDIFF